MQLGTLIVSDLVRSRTRLAIVGAAVAMGVAVTVVLGALGLGVYDGVIVPMLPRLPLDLLRVEPRTLSVGLLAFDAARLTGGGGLDDAAVARLGKLDGVAAVYPVVGASFPMRAQGGQELLGRAIRTDLFATGVAPELVAGDVAKGKRFEDPGPGTGAGTGAGAGQGPGRVPVLVARRLLDLYNTTVAPALDRPRLSAEAVIGFSFELELGASYMRGTPDPDKVEHAIAEIVGFSDQATLVGITVPEATVRRWNERIGGGRSPITGAYVRTRGPEEAGRVVAAIEAAGLKVDDTAKVLGAAVALGGLLFALFGLSLLALAGFAIAQTFFLLVAERRTELAVLRAMGARRRDLRRLVLTEAALVGFGGGVLGVALGGAAAAALDHLALALLPDIPFRPHHVLALSPALILISWALGVLAAVAGALVPALSAARASPARALRT